MHPNSLHRLYLNEEKYANVLNHVTQYFSVSKNLEYGNDTAEDQKKDFGNVVQLRARINQKNSTQ
jgi:hypothetical protein